MESQQNYLTSQLIRVFEKTVMLWMRAPTTNNIPGGVRFSRTGTLQPEGRQ
jgi:hypothetical protein